MNKTLMILVLIATLLLGGVASALELSFDTAVDLMNEQNLALRIAELNLQVANLDYDRSIASNLMADSQYAQLQAEYNLARAKNAYQTSLDNNYLETFRKYTAVLAGLRDLQIRQYETVIAEHNYKVVQEKVRMGDASKLDDLKELNRLESALRTEESSENTLAESIRSFKSMLHLQSEDEFSLITTFTIPEFELDLKECISIALENSFDVWDRESSLKLQEMQLQKAKIDGTPPIDIRRSKLSLEIARLNHEQAQVDLIEKITSSYHSLEQSKGRYTSALRELEISKDSYEISEQQAKIGLITEMQLLESKLNLLRAEGSVEDAVVAYIVSQIQFEQLIGLDVKRP